MSNLPVVNHWNAQVTCDKMQTYLARQPILDVKNEIIGYELLFRGSDSTYAAFTDHTQASASVIFDTLTTFGYEKLLGSYKGFINVNNDILMSDSLELLHPSYFVLELLEIMDINNAVIERCRELKYRGFSLALDDNLFSQAYSPLYELVDIVKVDVLSMDDSCISKMVESLKSWPIQLLAEKVETEPQRQFCLELGFQLFQGYYFARPVNMLQNGIGSDRAILMLLLKQVISDSDIRQIEQTFKKSPELIYKLLRLVNSVTIAHREKISTLRQAITTIGLQHLKRWVLMALFANKQDENMQPPLMEMAIARGRLIELAVLKKIELCQTSDYPDLAFISGLLSLLDVQLGVPVQELVEQLNLCTELQCALLERQGPLGQLIALCECLENDNTGGIADILENFGIKEADLLSIQLESINWTNNLLNNCQPS